MRLLITFFTSSLLAVCVASTFADEVIDNASNGQQDIKPFSSLQWDDGIGDVVTKLNNLSGLSEMTWGLKDDATTINVLSVSNPEDLSKVATEIYHVSFEKFVDSSGKTVIAPANIWNSSVIAKSVSVADIPFKLTATLQNSPGFAVTYPQKVISFQSWKNKSTAFVDAVLVEVQLRSDSPTIPEKLDGLIATVKAKYPKGELNENKEGSNRSGSLVTTDNVGRQFKLTWVSGSGESTVEIDYAAYESSQLKWAELYRKHLAALEEKKSPPAKDMKSDL